MAQFSELVEGEWNGFIFKFVTQEDQEPIFEHLRKYWYSDDGEIMAKYAGAGNDEDFVQDFQGFCQHAIAGDTSFVARDAQTNEIAALRLTFTSRKSQVLFTKPIRSNAFKKLGRVIHTLEKEANLFELYGIDHLAYFLVASVAVKYRGRGLATEMYSRSLALLKAKGFPLVQSAFSSPFTRKAVTKMGFVEVSRAYLKDFKDENGEMDFKGCADEDYTAIMCLKL